jgi:hypothetical protein
VGVFESLSSSGYPIATSNSGLQVNLSIVATVSSSSANFGGFGSLHKLKDKMEG